MFAGAVAVVAAVPASRAWSSIELSRLILLVTSPFAPSFQPLPTLSATTKVVAADGSVLATLNNGERRQPVTLGDLPSVVPHAVLAAEDANFYKEAAVNPLGIARALVTDVGGNSTQGGSTITQQLAKINYTGSKRSIIRKLNELLYADQLERHYTKDELLIRYLNQVYFGDGAYGIAAAANTFFDVPVSDLTADQAAVLAGKIRNPEPLDPFRNPAATKARRDEVLRAMAVHGWLPAGQLAADVAAPLGAKSPPPQPEVDPLFVDYVKSELATLPALGDTPADRQRAVATGGYTVDTTLDPATVAAAEDATKSYLGSKGDPSDAVVSVQPGNGAIRVFYGGLGAQAGGFDDVVQAHRQPGSSFKPFTYLAALQMGIDPMSVLPTAEPVTFQYIGGNGQQRTWGPVSNAEAAPAPYMTINDGLAYSVNTVFAQLALKVGAAAIVHQAEDAGIPASEIQLAATDNDPSITLGTLGVRPIDMATAYATLAAGGLYAAPYSVTRVYDSHGHLVYQHVPDTHQALDHQQVAVLTDALQNVVKFGTGMAANWDGRPLAGKTGTADNEQDAWFVGFTPQLATAVWVGYLKGEIPMTDVHGIVVYGGTYPAEIFSKVMASATSGDRPLPLDAAPPQTLGGLQPFSALPWPPGVSGTDVVTTTTTLPGFYNTGPTNPTTTTTPASSTTSSSTTSTTGRETTTTKPKPTTTSSTTSTTRPAPTSTTTATTQPAAAGP